MSIALVRIVGGSLFLAGALICLGFGIALLYETIAYVSGALPTISGITAEQLSLHQHWRTFGYLAAGILIGALAVHFANWLP